MIEAAQSILGTIAGLVGTIVLAGGGLAAIAYWLFRIFSEKWLTAKFEERLAAYKHAQQRELEHLRFQIDALMDRTVKLHQKEFDTLPQAWSLFNDAYWQISGFMDLRRYPDLDRMNEAQLGGFLEKSSMAQWQKDEIKSRSDKSTYYANYASWKELIDAGKAYSEWQIFFLKNSIFMPESIKEKFSVLDKLLKGALVEYETRRELRDFKLSECKDFIRLSREGGELRSDLEAEVRKRLWDSAKFAEDAST